MTELTDALHFLWLSCGTLSRSFFSSVSPCTRPRSLAPSALMRLHRKIFHDIKTLLSETFLYFWSEALACEQRQETKHKSFVQLNQSEINFLSQTVSFMNTKQVFPANISLIILFVSWLPIAQQFVCRRNKQSRRQ